MSNKDNMDLEVVITKKEGVFIATTPSFPKCKGTAKTKKEALSKLSQAIGRFIGRAVHKQIEPIITGKDYSKVVLDPTNKTRNDHLIFSLMPKSKMPTFEDMIMSLSHFNSGLASSKRPSSFVDIDSLSQSPYAATIDSSGDTKDSNSDFIFGIPISLN